MNYQDHSGALDQAQRFIDQHEPDMAAYVLRDLELSKIASADGLLWAAYKYGCVKNDIQPVIKDLRELNSQLLSGKCMACGDNCGMDMLTLYGRLALCPVCAESYEEEEE